MSQVIHFISDVIYPLPTTNTMADLLSTDERFLQNIIFDPKHLQRHFSLSREVYPIPQGFQLFGQPWELQIFLTWLPVRDPLPCLLLPMMPLPRYQIRMMKMLIMLMNMMMMTLMMTMMMTMIMTMTMTFHPPTMAFPRSRRRFLQSYLPILRLSPSFF